MPTHAQIAADARKPYADAITKLAAERDNAELREYEAQGIINALRSQRDALAVALADLLNAYGNDSPHGVSQRARDALAQVQPSLASSQTRMLLDTSAQRCGRGV